MLIHAEPRWVLLVALALLPACGQERAAPGTTGDTAPAEPAGSDVLDHPLDTSAAEPQVMGTVVSGADRKKLPADLFVCVFATDAPPPSLYRLRDAPEVLWIPVAADGSFRLDDLASGTYSILVSDGRFPLSPIAEIDVPTPAARDCRLVLETNCDYDIHVTDSSGQPTANVEVSVLRTIGGVAYIGRTDGQGTFAIEGALIGDYLCNLKPPGAHLPKHKGLIGLRIGPRGASYYRLVEADYR